MREKDQAQILSETQVSVALLTSLEKAFKTINLSAEASRELLKNSQNLESRFLDLLWELSQKTYANNHMPFYRYPLSYQAKSLSEQWEILNKYFPQLKSYDNSLEQRKLPKGAEAYFLIPNWKKLASTYQQAFKMVLDLVMSDRALTTSQVLNGRDNALRYFHIGQTKFSLNAWQKIEAKQGTYDYFVIPAQFGFKYRSLSVNALHTEIPAFRIYEFGLGFFEVLSMLLSHPERLESNQDLGIICPGDEVRSHAEIKIIGSPIIYLSHLNTLEFYHESLDYHLSDYGLVTGFF